MKAKAKEEVEASIADQTKQLKLEMDECKAKLEKEK